MIVSVRTQGFTLTPAINSYVNERVDGSLQKFSTSVMSAEIFLRDTNGPKGGPDKAALCVIRLRHGASITVESTHADLYAAVRRSCRRASRAVRRALGKHRRFARDAHIAESIRSSARGWQRQLREA